MGALISTLLSIGSGWLSNRQEIAKAKTQARINSVANGIPGVSDEFLVLVWFGPFVANFAAPFFGDVVQAQIDAALDRMVALPEWYLAVLMTVTLAVFGIDKVMKFKGVGT